MRPRGFFRGWWPFLPMSRRWPSRVFYALQQVSAGWSAALEGSVTVELVPNEGDDPAQTQERVQRALEILRKLQAWRRRLFCPRPTCSTCWSRGSVARWMPRHCPCRKSSTSRFLRVSVWTLDLLNQRLAAASGAVADDHADWQNRLTRFLGTMEWAALAVVSVIAAAAVIMVAFATRGSLATHRETIELLHLIGAPDTYIARQFQSHAMRLAFIGSILGAILAAATVFAIANSAAGLNAMASQSFTHRMIPIVATLVLPPVAAVVALVTARRMVLSALKRMVWNAGHRRRRAAAPGRFCDRQRCCAMASRFICFRCFFTDGTTG